MVTATGLSARRALAKKAEHDAGRKRGVVAQGFILGSVAGCYAAVLGDWLPRLPHRLIECGRL